MKLLQLYVTSEVTTNDSFIHFHVWQISDERTKKDKVVSDVSRPNELYQSKSILFNNTIPLNLF